MKTEDNWWLDNFFEENKEFQIEDFTKADVTEACEELKKVYDKKWYDKWQEIIRKHKQKRSCVSSKVFTGDIIKLIGHIFPNITFYKLLTIGKNIRLIGGYKKLPKTLVDMMRNPKQIDKAYVEIEIASRLIKNKFKVTLHPFSPKSGPDIKTIINKKEIYIEITSFDTKIPSLQTLSKQVGELKLDKNLGKSYMKKALRKYTQLPKDSLGVIIIDTPILLTSKDIQQMVKTGEKELKYGKRRIIAVLKINILSEIHGLDIGLTIQPILFIINPKFKSILNNLAYAVSSFN